jgi:hypothetical protein
MEIRNEAEAMPVHEQHFKEQLLELGLLTEITPPLRNDAYPKDRQPAPVSCNSVSQLVIKDRR